MSAQKTGAQYAARMRERQRAAGLREVLTALHTDEIAALDRLKERLGASSRSEIVRVLIAKTDLDALSPADIAALKSAA